MPLHILLNGAKGRMGQSIAAVAGEMDAAIRAATDAGDNPAAHLAGCDVIIDFSAHSGTGRLLELAVTQQKPIVIGTTGHGAEEKKKLLALAARIPCVWAGKYTFGKSKSAMKKGNCRALADLR